MLSLASLHVYLLTLSCATLLNPADLRRFPIHDFTYIPMINQLGVQGRPKGCVEGLVKSASSHLGRHANRSNLAHRHRPTNLTYVYHQEFPLKPFHGWLKHPFLEV